MTPASNTLSKAAESQSGTQPEQKMTLTTFAVGGDNHAALNPELFAELERFREKIKLDHREKPAKAAKAAAE
jgi:hypothetical protein